MLSVTGLMSIWNGIDDLVILEHTLWA